MVLHSIASQRDLLQVPSATTQGRHSRSTSCKVRCLSNGRRPPVVEQASHRLNLRSAHCGLLNIATQTSGACPSSHRIESRCRIGQSGAHKPALHHARQLGEHDHLQLYRPPDTWGAGDLPLSCVPPTWKPRPAGPMKPLRPPALYDTVTTLSAVHPA